MLTKKAVEARIDQHSTPSKDSKVRLDFKDHKGNKNLTTRFQRSKRKSTLTMKPLHQDLHFIRDKILAADDGVVKIDTAVDGVEANLAEAEFQQRLPVKRVSAGQSW